MTVTSPYINTDELAELLRTSPATLRFWRYKGTGPASVKLGRRVLYNRADVEAWIAAERASRSGPTRPHEGHGADWNRRRAGRRETQRRRDSGSQR